MNHLAQMQRGLDLIESRLDAELDLREVSRAAGMSHWHFQRVFKARTGETLYGYVRARRLAVAADRLRDSDARVLEIALDAGFESQEAFTRAFKRSFGLTPGRYRRDKPRHRFLTKLQLAADDLRHLDGLDRDPEWVAWPALRLVGLRTPFYGRESEKNNIGHTLGPLWDDFVPRLGEIAGANPMRCFGVISATGPDADLLRYDAAVASPAAPPPGMDVTEVPAATWAVFTHRGLAAEIDRTVSYIYATWLPRSGHRHTLGPDLELYDERWHRTSASSIMRYAIPIVPETA
jgi:AraC family transcriptional regulator